MIAIKDYLRLTLLGSEQKGICKLKVHCIGQKEFLEDGGVVDSEVSESPQGLQNESGIRIDHILWPRRPEERN